MRARGAGGNEGDLPLDGPAIVARTGDGFKGDEGSFILELRPAVLR
jgi:hypothetical protein